MARKPRKPVKRKTAVRLPGIPFRNKHLAEAALTHPSFRNESPCPRLINFDRLEFLGDAILNYVICARLYELFPDFDEGQLSRLRSTLVSRKILARIARELKLHRALKLGKSTRNQSTLSRDKILCDSFEALLAAIYFDGGLPRAEAFLAKSFQPYLDPKRILRLDPNPKSTLQEFAQKHWKKIPVYKWDSAPKGIRVDIRITPKLKTSAVAVTRKKAEEQAAQSLLRLLRQEVSSRSSKKRSSERKFPRAT